MKFIGTSILLVILNFCLVFAAPYYKQQDEKFNFWITTDYKASIVGLRNTNLDDIVIPPYFVVDDKRYVVNEISSYAFYNTKIRSVKIGSNINNIEIQNYAFSKCSALKTFTIDSPKVTVGTRAFENSNPDMVIKGSGVPSFVKSFCTNLVKIWGFKVNKDYTNLTQYERKKDLFTLAKELNKYVTFSGNADQGNAAVALALRHASWGGIARAYYQLALAIGIKDTEVLIGGDYNVSAWNYVKVDGKWYNVDVARFDFNTYKSYTNTFFYTKVTFGQFLNAKQPTGKFNEAPARWVVCRDVIHYQGEPPYNDVIYLDNYLRNFNLGSRA